MNEIDFWLHFLSIQLVNGDEIFRACDRHSVKIVTLKKYIAQYTQM